MLIHDLATVKFRHRDTFTAVPLCPTCDRDTYKTIDFEQTRLGDYTGLVWYQCEAILQPVNVKRLCTTFMELPRPTLSKTKVNTYNFVYFSTLWGTQTCLSLTIYSTHCTYKTQCAQHTHKV